MADRARKSLDCRPCQNSAHRQKVRRGPTRRDEPDGAEPFLSFQRIARLWRLWFKNRDHQREGKRGYVRYGCPSHRYRGVCRNELTIRQDRLEQQLLAALEACILNSQVIEYTLQRFQEELQKRLAEIQRHSTGSMNSAATGPSYSSRLNA